MNARISFFCALLLAPFVTFPGSADAAAPDDPQDSTAEIVAESRTDRPVRVYALRDGHMVPLGLVPEEGRARLVLPSFFVDPNEPIRLVLDALRARDWSMTDPVTVHAGQDLDLVIASDLADSTVSGAEPS